MKKTLALLALLVTTVSCALHAPQETSSANSFNEISNLDIGEAQIISFANGVAQIEFVSGDANQHYLLAITGGLSGMGLTVDSFTGNTTLPTAGPDVPSSQNAPTPDPLSPTFDPNPSGFSQPHTHDWFREQEAKFPHPQPLGLSAGSNFKVLANTNASYTTITATLVSSAAEINVYVDNATTLALDNATLSEMTEKLNDLSVELISLFGTPSDINGNGRVDVVLTPILENFGNNNPLSGYFWAGDLQSVALQQASNEREVIFLIAPELSSFYGGTVPADEVMLRILPGVYAHELQHLLNYMNKTTPEDPTINESISHAIENYFRYPHELRYKQEDCLEGLETVDLGSSKTDLATRGCGGLLIQHICEQTGNAGDCLARMITNPANGWSNIAQTAGEDLGVLIAKFLAGIILTGNPIGSNSPYQFQPLGVGPAGDVTGYTSFGIYNDYRHTTVTGPIMEEEVIHLPFQASVSGFAKIVHITGEEALAISVQGSGGFYANGASAVVIRIQ